MFARPLHAITITLSVELRRAIKARRRHGVVHSCDGAVAKVADGDLEADGGREEDAHQPLEEALELADEDVMEVVAAAEGQAGDEGAAAAAGERGLSHQPTAPGRS